MESVQNWENIGKALKVNSMEITVKKKKKNPLKWSKMWRRKEMKLGAENEVSCDLVSPWKWLDQCTCWPLGIRLLEVSFSHFLEGRVGTQGKGEWEKMQSPPVRLLGFGSWSLERRGCRQKKNKSLHQWLSVKGPFLWSPSNKLWYYMEKRPFPPITHWK